MNMNWIRIGAISAALAVAAGAFGAHALKGQAEPAELAAFDTAARYHLIHALGMVVLGALPMGPWVNRAGLGFLAGTILFSGSLYILGATGSRALVLVTPIGGLAFIIGWICLSLSASRRRD